MDTIENKVQQLKELSQKQKKISEFKQDIADILWNANMDEKAKIAKEMSKIQPKDDEQEMNLGFIVPHIVKENYGPEIELKIPKKQIVTPEPVIKQENIPEKPEVEPVVKKVEPVVQKQEPVVKKEVIEDEEVKISGISKLASKIQVVPGFEIKKPDIETEEITSKESVVKEVQAEIVQENKPKKVEQIVETEEVIPEEKKEKKKKVSSRKKLWQKIKPKTKEEKIKVQEEKVKKIEEEKEMLKNQLEEAEKNEKK